MKDDIDYFMISWHRPICTKLLCFDPWLWPQRLTLSSPGSLAASKNQIFTVPCLPSKHPFYMTYLFNYASFHTDKKSTAGPGQVESIFHQLYSLDGFDSKQTERNFGCTYDIC